MQRVTQYIVFAICLYAVFCVWLHATGAEAGQAQPVPRSGDASKEHSQWPVHNGSQHRDEEFFTIENYDPRPRTASAQEIFDMFGLVTPFTEAESPKEPRTLWPQESRGPGDGSKDCNNPPVYNGSQYRFPEDFHIVQNPHGPRHTEQETVKMFGIGVPANATERGWGKAGKKQITEEVLYVRLMDEGTEVFRPVLAKRFENMPDVYQILMSNSYDTGEELWEFFPGNVVRVKAKMLGGEWVFVATALAE